MMMMMTTMIITDRFGNRRLRQIHKVYCTNLVLMMLPEKNPNLKVSDRETSVARHLCIVFYFYIIYSSADAVYGIKKPYSRSDFFQCSDNAFRPEKITLMYLPPPPDSHTSPVLVPLASRAPVLATSARSHNIYRDVVACHAFNGDCQS